MGPENDDTPAHGPVRLDAFEDALSISRIHGVYATTGGLLYREANIQRASDFPRVTARYKEHVIDTHTQTGRHTERRYRFWQMGTPA